MEDRAEHARSIARSREARKGGRRAPRGLCSPVAAVIGLVACVHGGGAVPGSAQREEVVRADAIERLVDRAAAAEDLWRRVEVYYEREIAPIERVLLRYRDDPVLARRIARALVTEARHVGLEPRLLLAVLLVENPWLDPDVRSSAGAVGLMQVMPRHDGNWPPCEAGLEDVESNICHGARIFAYYFQDERGDVERALLRYNGCVHGTHTPNCHTYPYHVYARAGRASILAWLRPLPDDATAQ